MSCGASTALRGAADPVTSRIDHCFELQPNKPREKGSCGRCTRHFTMLAFWRIALLYDAATALRPPLPSRRASIKRFESLLDVAVDATPSTELAAWLEGWQCASDPQFPVETTIQDGALRLRYAAMPSHGVDVVARAPGADSPSTRIAVERVGGPAPSTINSLLRGAEERILDGLRRDLERDFGASLLRPPPKPQRREKQEIIKSLTNCTIF